jgi:hypothetical protein
MKSSIECKQQSKPGECQAISLFLLFTGLKNYRHAKNDIIDE